MSACIAQNTLSVMLKIAKLSLMKKYVIALNGKKKTDCQEHLTKILVVISSHIGSNYIKKNVITYHITTYLYLA